MAAIDWDDVVSHAPELSTTDVDAQDDILDHVNTALVVAKFGGESSGRLKLARIYLAAHLASVSGQGGVGVAGPVTSETAGGLSRTYAVLSATAQQELQGSTYGQLFLDLVRTSSARGPMVI